MIKDWSDVTLSTWMRMNEITARENEIERIVGFVALFNEMTEDEVLALPLDKFKEYMAQMGWMNTPPDIEQPKQEYTINGKTYVLTMNFHKLTTAQYIDFQSYTKSEDYSQMLSVFLIPKGKKYGEDYDVYEVQQDLKQMPVQEVLGLMGFFIILYRSWSRALLKYSSRILRKAAKREKNPELMETVTKMEELADMFGFR
ncbi:MAG: hypothetical protein J6U15_06210 [Lachnospiraceae bacterium]|nr:hypothetical protein [Lachnospiraceae bacterium]